MAVDCRESQPSNAEGAEPDAQPKEAGPPRARGEIAVDGTVTAGKASRPMPKARSPVPSLRRRGQGRDSCRLLRKLAVQCSERRLSQGRVKHERSYQAHASRKVESRWYLTRNKGKSLLRGTRVAATTTYECNS